MYGFQICSLTQTISLGSMLACLYLTWIFYRNLKANICKTEFFIFPWKRVPHSIFHSCTWNHYPFTEAPDMDVILILPFILYHHQLSGFTSNFCWLSLQTITLSIHCCPYSLPPSSSKHQDFLPHLLQQHDCSPSFCSGPTANYSKHLLKM